MKPLADAARAMPLLIGLAVAVVQTVLVRRVSNAVTAAIGAGGVFAWVLCGGARGGLGAVAAVAALLLLGVAPFARGWVGGGDVKLLAAVGAWVGVAGVPRLLALTVGLVLGAVALSRSPLGRVSRVRGVPYGLAIAGGALLTFLLERP